MAYSADQTSPPVIKGNPGIMSASKEQKRDISIDAARSTYIIMMITYHCFSNVYSRSPSFMPDINLYLVLVSGSFPFLAGFLIGNYYLNKVTAVSNETSIRLATRGLRLLLIYILANILVLYTLKDIISQPLFAKTTHPLMSILSVNPSYVVFDILVPLGAILIIGAVLVTLANNASSNNLILYTLVVGLCGIILAIDARHPYMACGLTGITLGHQRLEKMIIPIYNKYRAAIVLSFVYGLLLSILCEAPRDMGIFYVVGVVLLFYSIRGFALAVNITNGIIAKELSFYSRYSLLIYLTHVPLLLFIVNQKVIPLTGAPPMLLFMGLMFVIFTAMSLLIRFIDRMRNYSPWFNKSYALIFG